MKLMLTCQILPKKVVDEPIIGWYDLSNLSRRRRHEALHYTSSFRSRVCSVTPSCPWTGGIQRTSNGPDQRPIRRSHAESSTGFRRSGDGNASNDDIQR